MGNNSSRPDHTSRSNRTSMFGKLPSSPPEGALSNAPTLYVIVPYSNPANFARRRDLLNQTIQRLKLEKGRLETNNAHARMEIVVSEIAYADSASTKPPSAHSNGGRYDLRFATTRDNVLWAKENLVNVAIEHLVRTHPSATYFAWVDGDITFESNSWVQDTIAALQRNPFSLIQLFSTATLLGPDDAHLQVVKGFGYQYATNGVGSYKNVPNSDREYWHPGFAWATTHAAWEIAGGLLERTLGSADRHMAMCCLGKGVETYPEGLHWSYGVMIAEWEERVKGVEIGYVPGNVRHSWHGDLRDRGYMERWEILKKWDVDVSVGGGGWMVRRTDGIMVWSAGVPDGLKNDVVLYFKSRNEDVKNTVSKATPRSHGAIKHKKKKWMVGGGDDASPSAGNDFVDFGDGGDSGRGDQQRYDRPAGYISELGGPIAHSHGIGAHHTYTSHYTTTFPGGYAGGL
ncbi:hypothetical protein BJ742DRAFT_833960 [Cladochytrium replicatum]|nr:hypothetical protein BJ742DRAFT_833960 [Cladochytrium replicatum]